MTDTVPDLTAAQLRVLAIVSDGERSFWGFQRGDTLWIDFGETQIPYSEFQFLVREYLLNTNLSPVRATAKGRAALARGIDD